MTSRMAQIPAGARPLALVAAGQPERQPETARPMLASESVMAFVEMEIEARRCANLDSLRYAIVNAPRRLVPYQQAFLIEPGTKGYVVTRASNVTAVDRHAPLIVALTHWLNQRSTIERIGRGNAEIIDLGEVVAGAGSVSGDARAADQAVWLPLLRRDGRTIGGLLALQHETWRPQHLPLLLPLMGAYAHAWEALEPRRHSAAFRRALLTRLTAVTVGGALLAAAFIPVPMSALAPAEIVAREPALVTAPLDGVVGEILHPPGTWVEAGTPIVRLVDVTLRNAVAVAERRAAVAQARYFKTVQSATVASKNNAELAELKAEFEVARADLAYAEDTLARAEIKATAAGLLIYAAKSDWVGKPVTTGERLMEIGDPARTELRIDLPVSDTIAVETGSPVALFLDGDPLAAIPAVVARTSYRPTMTPDQQLAFRVSARFRDDGAHRIGLRGVARVSGSAVPLWFYLLRRPIAAMRQRLGL